MAARGEGGGEMTRLTRCADDILSRALYNAGQHRFAPYGTLVDGEHQHMKYLVYEDRITHEFAIIRLPPRFVEGDKPPIPASTRWFGTRDEALATLASLFDQEEDALLERNLQ